MLLLMLASQRGGFLSHPQAVIQTPNLNKLKSMLINFCGIFTPSDKYIYEPPPTRLVVGETVDRLGSMTLLEVVCHWGWTFSF